MTLRTLTAAAAVTLMVFVPLPLQVWEPLHLFLWSHHVAVPARFVYLVGVWAAIWIALGRIRSVCKPTTTVAAILWLMAGSIIVVLLGMFAVFDAQHRGRWSCSKWIGSQCVSGHAIRGTAEEAALEGTAAALTLWFALVGSRTSRPKMETPPS